MPRARRPGSIRKTLAWAPTYASAPWCRTPRPTCVWAPRYLRRSLPADIKEAACGVLGRSGSRLKAYHRVFDDGTVFNRSAFAIWVDTQTGQGCRFGIATDNSVRCLPSGPHFSSGAIGLYLDAACKQPLYLRSRCAEEDPLGPPKFAIEDDVANECSPEEFVIDFRQRVHELGAAVTPAIAYGLDPSEVPARCTPIDQLDPLFGGTTLAEIVAAYELRPLGPEVPPSTFVGASPSVPGRSK